MPGKKPDLLRPEVVLAQRKLAAALDEACDTDPDDADTGKLIRLEESLAIATAAAKEAISVRRRFRDEQREQAERLREAHRRFEDAGGVRWDVFAVRPSAATGGRALPERFRHGWLSFTCETETRRLAPIPERWNELPENGLRELCDRAETATRRKR